MIHASACFSEPLSPWERVGVRADDLVMFEPGGLTDRRKIDPYSSRVQSDPRFAGFTPGRPPVFGAGLPDGRLSTFCAMRVAS